jgi:hypothetical protein
VGDKIYGQLACQGGFCAKPKSSVASQNVENLNSTEVDFLFYITHGNDEVLLQQRIINRKRMNALYFMELDINFDNLLSL